VPRIGTLEQFNLSSILQRVETHAKTGLLTVKQGQRRVEFYFRAGQLMCIGPIRTSVTLAERLLQDKVISPQVFQYISQTLSPEQQGETPMALILLGEGLVQDSELRAWATRKTHEVLDALLKWLSGEIYFEEEVQPPPDRLLVALTISSLLSSIPNPITPMVSGNSFSQAVSGQIWRTPTPPAPDIAKLPTLMSASQFFQNTPTPLENRAFPSSSPAAASAPETDSLSLLFSAKEALPSELPQMPFPETDSLVSLSFGERSAPATGDLSPLFDVTRDSGLAVAKVTSLRPEPVTHPTPPKRIDTSFMRPEMVLVPADFSVLREQNPQIQITPDQWQLLARVDGRTSLLMVSHECSLPPTQVCQIAGELMAEGLIQTPPSSSVPVNEYSPVSGPLQVTNLGNGHAFPAYRARTTQAQSPALPISDVLPTCSPDIPFETESQWGNGGNGATFVPGRGWVATPQSLQPLQSSGPLATHSDVYAQIGNRR